MIENPLKKIERSPIRVQISRLWRLMLFILRLKCIYHIIF